MKPSLLSILSLSIQILGSSAGADEARPPASLPRRSPGLWRITTISPEIGMQTNEVCIEESDSIIGAPDSSCDAPAVTRADDQVIVTIECGQQGRRDVTSLLFTGDFTTWYRAQSKATAGANRSGFTIEAKFIRGRCGG